MLWSSRRRLDPARHRFLGFPEDAYVDAMRDLRLHVGVGAPEFAVHRNVRYLPPRRADPDPWATGGLISSSGDLIPLVRDWSEAGQDLLGLRKPEASGPGERIEGDVLYLGWLFEMFGHILIESLARIWALDFVPATTNVLFHYWPGVEPPQVAFDILALFGIDRDRIIIPQGPATFSSLLIPDPMFLITSVVHERAAAPFRAVADRITGETPLSDQPIYLSRSNLSSGKRAIAGEAAFEALLRDNGFLIVHPETMSIAEQIRIVASHRTIALCKGGAAELLLFAHPGARVHYFTARPMLEDNVLISETTGVHATYHYALRMRVSPFAAVRLDLDAAIAGLVEDGLLPNLSRVPFLPSDRDLDAEFDELWLYSLLTGLIPMDDAALSAAEPLLDTIRATAWPVFAALAARMPADRLSDAQADTMMTLFTNALLEEPDAGKRYRYAAQVRALAEAAYPRCTPETQAIARAAIEARLPMSV
jgi:capsular polysaccharide biosynthesis protein